MTVSEFRVRVARVATATLVCVQFGDPLLDGPSNFWPSLLPHLLVRLIRLAEAGASCFFARVIWLPSFSWNLASADGVSVWSVIRSLGVRCFFVEVSDFKEP